MASKHRRGRPSSRSEGRPLKGGRSGPFGYPERPHNPLSEQGDGVRVIAESEVDYRPSLSLRLGPELTSRLQLAAFARRWAPETLVARLLIRGLEQEPDRIRAEAAVEILTPREREVTRLTAMGKTNHEIAYELGISRETVKSHIRRTLAKLGLHSKSDLRLLIQALDPWGEGSERDR